MSSSKKTLAKGCAGISILFLLLFIWGIWTVFTGSSDQIQRTAYLQSYLVEEKLNEGDGTIEEVFTPVVSYEFEGKTYQDTLVTLYQEKLPQDSVFSVYFFPESPSQATLDGPDTYYTFYLVYLFLALMAYGAYRRFSKEKPSETLQAPTPTKSPKETIHSVTETVENSAPTEVKKSNQAPPWMVVLIGFIVLLVGIGFGYYRYTTVELASYLKANGERVEGSVLEIHRSGKREGETFTYLLAYEWKGESFTYSTSFKSRFYESSDRISLLVDPENPDHVMIDSHLDMDKGSNLWTFILLGIGILIISMGVKQWKAITSV